MPRKKGDLNLKTLHRMSEAARIAEAEIGKLGLDAEAEKELLHFFKYRAGELIISTRFLRTIANLRKDFGQGGVWRQMAVRQARQEKSKAKKKPVGIS